jgi:nanoRNase/pAp phosphatase (c-di-AMP/oligoRNAs hydrolase)
MRKHKKTQARVERLTQILKGNNSLLILTQDNPDPDSIAAAVALRKIANTTAGIQCYISCGGTVGRAENRALVHYLNLKLHPLDKIDYAKFDLIALVDTQPGTGNNSLPEGLLPQIVIDHHPCRKLTRSVPFIDIRSSYGATATILTEYLNHLDISPEPQLATALLYGIRSDTQDLGRNAIQADIRAIELLYPCANKRMLSEIQRGEVPRDYYQMLADGLKNARICGPAVMTSLGQIDNPDMIAEVADLLLREDSTSWSMCTGFAQDKLLVSIRTSQEQKPADKVMAKIVARRGTGGGHPAYAGGQIPLKKQTKAERRRLEKIVREKFLNAVGNKDCKPQSLISS